MPDQVRPDRKRERMGRMLETAAAAEEAFQRAHLGEVGRVLWEGRRAGRWLGTTDNYLRVSTDGERENLRGTVTEARLIRVEQGGLVAAL
jgi:tRNA A37 methylthiotransferase MiaB